jgi:hypothetical protein
MKRALQDGRRLQDQPTVLGAGATGLQHPTRIPCRRLYLPRLRRAPSQCKDTSWEVRDR